MGEPEPQPEAVEEKLKRLPEPDKDSHRAKIEGIQENIAKKQERMQSIRDTIERQSNARKSSREGQGGIRGELSACKKERQAKIEEKKAIRAAMGGARIDVPSKKDRPRMSVEDVDRRIQKLEDKQSTATLSLKEEKEVLQEIKALRQSRAGIVEFQANIESLIGAREAQDSKNKEFKSVLSSLDADIDALTAKRDVLQTKIDGENAKEKNDIPSLIEERDALRPEISALYDEMRALRDTFKKDNDIWWEHELKVKAQERIENQVKWEEQKKRKLVEDEEYRQMREADELAQGPMDPFVEQKVFCQSLVEYLEGLQAVEKKEVAKAAAVAVPEGAQKMGKGSENDVEESWGGLAKKGKKGKKKKDSTPKANKVLQHSIARIGAFGEIGLDAPTALEQIPALLATLAAKMAEYDEKAASMPAKAKKGLSKPRKVALKIQPRGESDLKVIIDVIPGN